MTMTLLKISRDSTGREALVRALADAGVEAVEVEDWGEARERLDECDAALVVCDGGDPDSGVAALKRAIAALGRAQTAAAGVAPDVMRSLSHELRTPLSAMAGWLHLMESGKLDEAALKRAIEKLKGNIEDQVRTIDRYLGATHQEGRR
jgi:signal transduction histidine kinase